MDDAAFLQMICADPDADGPRLLYADYLDEKGDPPSVARAEFIRVQCALAAAGPTDGVRDTLGEREGELLTAHWRDWLKPACQFLGELIPNVTGRPLTARYALNWSLPSPQSVPVHWINQGTTSAPPYLHSGQFRRGFLGHIALRSKPHKSAAHVARLFDREPVDGVTFIDHGGAEIGQRLGAIPADRLRVLELVGCPTEAVLAVVRSDKLKGLRDLVVMGTVGPDIGDEIGRSIAFPNLRALVLHRCGLDATGAVRLSEAAFVTGLERLELTGCHMSFATAQALERSFPSQNRLTYLALTRELDGQTVHRFKDRFGAVCQFVDDNREWPARYFQ